ncbi:UNVERIFIED_CONTAM: hypothetical protein NCL1_15741 [Trichonephila clavipes]
MGGKDPDKPLTPSFQSWAIFSSPVFAEEAIFCRRSWLVAFDEILCINYAMVENIFPFNETPPSEPIKRAGSTRFFFLLSDVKHRDLMTGPPMAGFSFISPPFQTSFLFPPPLFFYNPLAKFLFRGRPSLFSIFSRPFVSVSNFVQRQSECERERTLQKELFFFLAHTRVRSIIT